MGMPKVPSLFSVVCRANTPRDAVFSRRKPAGAALSRRRGGGRLSFCVPLRLVLVAPLIVFLVGGLLALPTYALPAGFQEYYILGNETQVFRMFQAIEASEGGSIGDPYMASVITIVATADHQIIHYDHWEDGYEADILNPVQSTTEVYGDRVPVTDTLKAGDIITLNSDGGAGIHQHVPVAPRGTELRYDSSDHLASTGGSIDIVHSLWPRDTTWIGGAWEIYPTGAWATGYSYVVPVGVDLYDGSSGYFADFKYVWLETQALDDNTTVHIDNGDEAVSVRLERGQTYSSMGYLDSISSTIPAITINGGTTILANKPLQVGLVTGGDDTFQTRFYTLVPDTAWGNEYVAPIPRTTGSNWGEVYLFNPDDEDHTVTAYDISVPSGITFTLPAATTRAYSQTTGSYLPVFSALRLRSDGPLWAVGSADAGNDEYDWGFSFVPTRFATRDYYVSWAPGNSCSPPDDPTCVGGNPAVNGSPVWVAPLSDNTAFRVDYSDPTVDGVPDEHFVLDSLQTRRIFDPDKDNTGMRLQADKPFVVIWGEDPDTAGTDIPYLDLGYSVLPLHPDWMDPVLTLHKASDVQALPSTGGTVTFTLSAQAADYSVSNLDITDTLPISWTYVPDSTSVTYPDGSTGGFEPTIISQTLFWDLSENLEADRAVEISFQAQLTMTGGLGDTCYDDLESGGYDGGFGWSGLWTEYEPGGCGGNCVDNTATGSPHSSSYHLVIRNSGAISRTASLSGFQRPTLRFWRQLDSLESGDAFYLRLYNGVSWVTVLTLTEASGQGIYMAEQLDLTSYRSADFALELEGSADSDDYLYLDDVEIFDAAATQENTAEATGTYEGYSFSSRDEAVIVLSPLSLRQSVDRTAIAGGDTLLYTLTYSNSSQTLTTTNGLIRDILPANTTFLSASQGATYLPAAHTVVWGRSPTMTLPAGVSGTLTVTVSVDDWVSNGQVLRSEGYIDSDQTVEVASNPVETVVRAPEVSLAKSGPASANPDQVITYTIEYANTGPVTATGVIITDMIPLSTTYQAGSLAVDTGSGYESLTDADDGDAGRFTGSAISVRPGGIVSGQLGLGEVGYIRFAVRISPTVSGGENIANYATLVRDYALPQNSALLLTVVSDLTLEKTADRSVAGPGTNISYTITLGSGGALTQTEVYVRDSIPDHTHYLSGTAIVPPGFVLSYSIDHGETWTTTAPATPTLLTDLRWYTPTISGTVDFTLRYQVQVEDPLSQGNVVIVNRAQVTSTQTPLLYSNEMYIQTVDLVVNKAHGDSPVTPGQRITYTITCGNNGSAAATGVIVSDTLPANTDFVTDSITLDPPSAGTTGTVPPTLASDVTINAGQSVTVTYAVTVNNPLPAGVDTITNTVVVTSEQGISATDTITTPVTAALDLAIAKDDGVASAVPGDVLTYTLAISNVGNQGATGVLVTDTLSDHTTFARASHGGTEAGRVVTWTISSLNGGATVTRTATVTVHNPLPAGVDAITNTVVVTSEQRISATDTITTPITAAPDLVIAKDDGVASAVPGDVLTYTLTISNVGNQGATVVVVTDTLSDHTTFARASHGGTEVGSVVTWSVGSLNGGATITRTVAVTVHNPLLAGVDAITDTAQVADDGANGTDQNPGDNQTTITTPVTAAPDLVIAKDDGVASAAPGDVLTYTLTISNVGNQGATGVLVTDTLSDHTTFARASHGGTEAGRVVTWTISSLNGGATVTRTVTITIHNPLPAGVDAITDTAQVADDGTNGSDPNIGNNIYTHTTPIEYAPALSLVKEGPTAANVSETVVFTFTVAHAGGSDGSLISSLSVTDTIASPVDYVSGDTNSNNKLDATETWVYTAAYTILLTDPDPLVNMGTAAALDEDDDALPIVTATHSTAIEYAPALTITKTGPTMANVGDTVVFTFTVSHDIALGDRSPITNVTVTDDRAGSATYVNGDDGDDELEWGESWIYTASYTTQRTDDNPLVNTGTIQGKDQDGDNVTATDTHTTTLRGFAPALNIFKQGPTTAKVGDTVVFTFTVTNVAFTPTSIKANANGDGSPISNVSVTDDFAGVASYVRGDDGDGLLRMGEAWVYTASYTIQATDPNPLVNTGTVTGEDGEGDPINNSDTHSTTIDGNFIFLPIVLKNY